MVLRDSVIGLLVAGGGLAVILEAQTFPDVPGQQFGSSFFPTVIGAALLATGALMALLDLLKGGGKWIQLPSFLFDRHAALSFLFVLSALIFYILASEYIGFDATVIAMTLGLMLWFGVRWRVAVPVSLVSTAVFHLIFGTLLRVPLPPGPLGTIF